RASQLYFRAQSYGLKALGSVGETLAKEGIARGELEESLAKLTGKDLEALFWTTLSWTAWINLNLDKPSALELMGRSELCLKKIIQEDPRYFHGLPDIMMGVNLAARAPMLGGNPKEARFHFEKALEDGGRRFFLAQYYYARYYAVRVQDKRLFSSLLREILDNDPGLLKDVCLINKVIQTRAGDLLKMADEFFF
ncbi:MAG: TRAP transporter TatT component family protein, partial [Pseudomonadota bacterium]